MLVFRENRVSVPARLLVGTLAEKLHGAADREILLDCLLRAGELECGLADASSPAAAQVAAVTDASADALVSATALRAEKMGAVLGALELPPSLQISPSEGFAYYALHPMKYADLASAIRLASSCAAVIGIRSIGTTLSAVVAAALKRRGINPERISVRPSGHPFDRSLRFTPEQRCWVEKQRDSAAGFLVVDEGPGLSGSSFLSVGEALIHQGIEKQHIHFLCSHYPNPASLRSRNGAARWASFRSWAVEHGSYRPQGGAIEISGGAWRQLGDPDTSGWPACWPQMERVKFLSQDCKQLLKFEGFGRFGAEVYERTSVIARAGFSPEPQDLHEGFAVYPWIAGRHGRATDLSESLLSRLADYCAFRACEFRCHGTSSAHADLAAMVRCNISEEFGVDPDVHESELSSGIPLTVDGRMHPHEWVRSQNDVWLKVDGGSHGDDHFFPGPTDIAWDLAGAIVEWNMDCDAAEYFLAHYRARSGDDPVSRLTAFLPAYQAFRLGYCKMAAESVADLDDRQRLTSEYEHSHSMLERHLPKTSFKLQVSGS